MSKIGQYLVLFSDKQENEVLMNGDLSLLSELCKEGMKILRVEDISVQPYRPIDVTESILKGMRDDN